MIPDMFAALLLKTDLVLFHVPLMELQVVLVQHMLLTKK